MKGGSPSQSPAKTSSHSGSPSKTPVKSSSQATPSKKTAFKLKENATPEKVEKIKDLYDTLNGKCKGMANIELTRYLLEFLDKRRRRSKYRIDSNKHITDRAAYIYTLLEVLSNKNDTKGTCMVKILDNVISNRMEDKDRFSLMEELQSDYVKVVENIMLEMHKNTEMERSKLLLLFKNTKFTHFGIKI